MVLHGHVVRNMPFVCMHCICSLAFSVFLLCQDYVDIPYAGDTRSVSGYTDVGDEAASFTDTGFFSDMTQPG